MKLDDWLIAGLVTGALFCGAVGFALRDTGWYALAVCMAVGAIMMMMAME